MDAKSPVATVTMLGLAAALVALWPALQAGAPTPPQDPPPAAPSADAQKPAGAKEEPAGNRAMQLVQAFFACERKALGGALATCSLDTLVATVPDPTASKLDWAFDQHLNALRRAHEAAGFVVDGFWLPWKAAPANAAEAALAGQHAGVMLFRSASGRALRLLFLVGEVPTAGIHKRALAAALRDRDELVALTPARSDAAAPPLRVVGPSFSGSAPSLRCLLDAWLDAQPARRADVVTGSATSAANADLLTRTDAGSARLLFSATVHTDETLLACLADDVLPELGLLRSDVAILQESSTMYGASVRSELSAPAAGDRAAQDRGRYLLMPFPLNVSSLRSAYASKPAAKPPPLQMFEIDADSRDHQGELPRPLSKLSPAVIDLLLAETCRALSEQRIRMVVLFATDVRDKVFLGSQIAKRLPDVQLVTTEGNLMHVRSELAEAQRGMLVLSSYPMFSPPGAWQPASTDVAQRLVFASDGAQGVYNATLIQLNLPKAVVDYAPPIARAGPRSRPPVWLTCVGKTRMLPVAVHVPRRGTARYPIEIELADLETHVLDKPMSLAALLLTLTLGLLILAVAFRMLIGVSGRSRRQQVMAFPVVNDDETDRAFAELLQIAYTLHAEIYRAIQMTVLTGLFLPHGALLWIVARTNSGGLASNWAYVSFGLVVVGLGVAAAATGWARVLRIAARYARRGWTFTPAGRAAWARLLWRAEIVLRTSIAVLGVVCFVAWVVYACCVAGLGGEQQHAEPFLQRATSIGEGVSPLLPLFLIGIGMVLWCAWHQRRARLLQEKIPFEAQEVLPSAMFGTERSTAAVRLSLTHAVPDQRGFVLGLGLLVTAAWLFAQRDRTLEGLVRGSPWMGWAFDTLFFPGLIAALLTTGWAAYRLVVVWRRAEALLDVQTEPRTTAACKRLVADHGLSMNLGLWAPAPRNDLQPAIARAWRRLWQAGATFTSSDQQALCELQYLLAVEASPMPGERAKVVARLRTLIPLVEVIDDRVLDAPAPATAAAHRRTWLAHAHDVFALELLGWLRWTTSHVRTLAFFLVLSLLVTTVLLWSYPFHPQRLLRGAFLVVSVGVLIALTTVITAMNRNAVLSLLSKGTPGQVTWDRAFVSNVLTFSLVPALTMVSAQVPAVGTSFLTWLEPLFNALKPPG